MPEQSILQLSAVAVLFAIAIREFFGYLKSRKQNGNGDSAAFNQAVFNELRQMNTNHLASIKDTLEKGNERLIDAIHNDNVKIIEVLGEIKGRLKL